jgi:Fe-S oxidoreductase
MTTTYDPRHPAYYDEGDLREEMTRVYDLCHGCRLCWNLCPSFLSLFEMIDAKDGFVEGLTPAEQDRVVNECYQCKLCYVKCPYVPPHEWQLDFPRLMMRADALERKQQGFDREVQLFGRTDLLGKVSTTLAPLVNRATGKPGSLPRRVMEKTVGIASQRVLPPYARQRFTTWWKKRARAALAPGDALAKVAVFPTCLVEYQDPTIGHDLVKVYEHNRVSCDVATAVGCCGMPWLDDGDVDNFTKQARKNLPALAAAVREGRDIVVPQPTCGYVLKREYPEYVGGDDARVVAQHTYDAAEYLMKIHREVRAQGGEGLNPDFVGTVPDSITWHVPCHLRAQNIGYKSRDLMGLTGATITPVDKCSGIDGTWGLRAKNYPLAKEVAQPMKRAIEADVEKATGTHVVAGDCHLANGAIVEETGLTPMHPIQVVARAYGIAPEPTR